MTRRAAVAGVALALPYLPFLLGARPQAGPGAATLLALAAIVAPGAAGLLLGRGRGSARRFVHALTGAALANVGAAILLRGLGVPPDPGPFAAALGTLTVAGGIVGAARGGDVPDPRRQPTAEEIKLLILQRPLLEGRLELVKCGAGLLYVEQDHTFGRVARR